MIRKLIGSGVAAALLGVLALASVAQAQGSDPLAQAAATNQTYVTQAESALAAPDLATLQARTRTALATGNLLESQLNSVLAAPPDDATRSRAQGLLDHLRAAQASGESALTATSLDAAQSAVTALRAEALEALSEVRPFLAPQAPAPAVAQAPTALPVTGGPSLPDPLVVAAAALSLVVGGFGLRRLRLA